MKYFLILQYLLIFLYLLLPNHICAFSNTIMRKMLSRHNCRRQYISVLIWTSPPPLFSTRQQLDFLHVEEAYFCPKRNTGLKETIPYKREYRIYLLQFVLLSGVQHGFIAMHCDITLTQDVTPENHITFVTEISADCAHICRNTFRSKISSYSLTTVFC